MSTEVSNETPAAVELLTRRVAVERDLKRQRSADERHRRSFYLDVIKVIDAFQRLLHNTDMSSLGEVAQNRFGSVRTATNLLVEVLEEEDVVAMDDPTGRPFDPSRHEAAEALYRPDLDEETVLETRERGYVWGDQVLRRARVAVSSQKPAA
jgi:molecular chaperone GrpE (heat shock protein)